MSLIDLFTSNGPTGFGYASTAEQVTANVSLVGQTILVTGTNSGLGFETMRVLAMRGAHVIASARTAERAQEAAAKVNGKITGLACELSDPKSVRAAVETVKQLGVKLNAIICNAGIMALPKNQQAFGYELQFFTNHIGHFILVTGLVDSLTDDGRVVMLSSEGHRMAPRGAIEFDNLSGERGYGPWKMYGQSKIANVLFAKELARRFAGTKRTANALHPGVIATNLSRSMNPILRTMWEWSAPVLLKSIEQGAATETYVAANPGAAGVSGQYFVNSNVGQARADTDDPAIAAKLWAESERIAAQVLG